MSDSLIDLSDISPKWIYSNNAPLIPSSGETIHDCEGSSPFDLIAFESATSSSAENDPFEMVYQSALQSNTSPEEIGSRGTSNDALGLKLKDAPDSTEQNAMQHVGEGKGKEESMSMSIQMLDEIPPPDALQSSLLNDTSDFYDMSPQSIGCPQISEGLPYKPSSVEACASNSFHVLPTQSNESFELCFSENLTKEVRYERIKSRISQIIQLAEGTSMLVGKRSCDTSEKLCPSIHQLSKSSAHLEHPSKAVASVDIISALENGSGEDIECVDSFQSLSLSLSMNCLNLTDDFLEDFGKEALDLQSKTFLSNLSTESNLSSVDKVDMNDQTRPMVSIPDINLPHAIKAESPIISVKATSPDCGGLATSFKGIPSICVEDVSGQTHWINSPTSLPPLPLSEDGVRDLSLCSKYTPRQKQCNSTKAAKSNCVQGSSSRAALSGSRLFLRKPTDKVKSTQKGPMRALLPVQNMTRNTSARHLSRSPTPIRQMASPSPSKSQKNVLTPLKFRSPNTTSSLPRALNRHSVSSPQCLNRSKVSSAGGQSTPIRSQVDCPQDVHHHRSFSSFSSRGSHIDKSCVKASKLRPPNVVSRASQQIEAPPRFSRPPTSNTLSSCVPGCLSPHLSKRVALFGGSKIHSNIKSSSPQKPRALVDVNHPQSSLRSPISKLSSKPRSCLSKALGKENV